MLCPRMSSSPSSVSPSVSGSSHVEVLCESGAGYYSGHTEDIYAEDEDSHTVFVKSINACSVKYEPAKRSLRVVSTDEDTQRKAAMIQGMYFQNFTQKVLLKSKTEEVERHLETTRIQSTYGYTEESLLPSELVGLATGANGANIQQARSGAASSTWSSRKRPQPFVSRGQQGFVRKARKLLEFAEDK
ncbi:Synaptic functional regulator FMR1 [Caligus rogercresseyi]|uniref:Synaptic functional regulator FMR1 n=1 Tax=Caligus rogercresseyi TaxID=217165 RepID=A0A7T8QUN2_CALRO|nr:Synaptic functional regulator FMR1 [Caligus rogercresseyi]